MQVSSAFVVIMGMGVTFVGLTCIIFLTMLMGKILSKPEAPKPAAAAAAPAAPAVPADGLTDEVKVAIMAAIAQQPGFNMANGASGDTAFFKKHSNINGFRTPEQRNYLYSALLKPSISAAIARFISR